MKLDSGVYKMVLGRPSFGKAAIFIVCLFGGIVFYLLNANGLFLHDLKPTGKTSRLTNIMDDEREVEVEFLPAITQEDGNNRSASGQRSNAGGRVSVTKDEAGVEMLIRRETLEKRCPKGKLNVTWDHDVRGHTLYNYPYMFSLCYVPKVGCTFWKSVFHYLEKPGITPEEFTDRLLHERKGYVHGVKLPFLFNLPVPQLIAFERKARVIVYARNPYTRLLSAYIDKFVNSRLWKSIGKVIVKRFRPGASEKSLNCGHDVTFEEFLRYAVDVGTTGKVYSPALDDHWTPVSSICNVCEMSYDYIGKLETFSRDRDYIFKELGLDKFITTHISRTDTSRDRINRTVTTNWPALNHSDCAPFEDVFSRLWFAFQMQGYIPLDVSPPFDRGVRKGMTRTELEGIVTKVFDERGVPSDALSKQRHQILVDAYRNVSLDVKLGIQRVFKYDFELFDYEIEPVELYSI